MKKQIIRLTEADLHRVIKESVNGLLIDKLYNKFGNFNENEYKLYNEHFINHFPFNNFIEDGFSLVKLTDEEKCNNIFLENINKELDKIKENNIPFKEILKEELSINEKIQDVCENIINEIKEHSRNLNGIKSIYGQVKKGFFEIEIFNKYLLSVRFTNVDCNNSKYLEYIMQESSSSFKEHRLNINCYSLNGNLIEKDIYDSVYHEVEHLFEQICKNKTYIETPKIEDFYKKINFLIRNDNILSKKIGQVIYLSLNFEQQAFLNGAYGSIKNELKNNNDVSKEMINALIKKTPLYKALLFLKEIITNENEEEIVTILKQIGMKHQDYKKIIENTSKKISKKIGRLTVKLYKDFNL